MKFKRTIYLVSGAACLLLAAGLILYPVPGNALAEKNRRSRGDEVILATFWGEDRCRVSGAAVIAPDDISAVMIQPGKELLTLLTCHPYASGGKYRFLAICEKESTEGTP